MVSTNVVCSRESVKNENCVGAVFIKLSPGCVGELGRGNASAVAESEISERNE